MEGKGSMSQEAGERRRSSMQNPRVQDELRSIVPQDVFRQCAGLQNITRLSGNTSRSSWNLRGTSSQGRGGSNSVTRRGTRTITPGNSRSGSTGTGPLKATAIPGPSGASASRGGFSISGRGLPSQSKISRVGSVTSINSTFNSTRRKSRSYDSLLFQTPGVTPAGRSRSKSPGMSTGRNRTTCNDPGIAAHRVKITKDKKVLADMAKCVFEFLDKQECNSKPGSWKDLVTPTTMPVSTFMNMVKFVASYFVGVDFFARSDKDKVKDDSDKITEVMKLLKYSGQISQSHLKTATAQHAWPSCLTFLAWLCCRAKNLENPPQERSIKELNSNDMRGFAFDSYLNLFPLNYSGQLTQADVDEELQRFKERVYDSLGTDVAKSKEELILELDQKKSELEQLQKVDTDPVKELKLRHASEAELENSLREKIKEAETKSKHYSDSNHLTLQIERCLAELDAKTEEMKRLQNQIRSQPMSKQEALKLANETEVLKVQLDSVVRLIAQLKSDLENRTRKVEGSRQQLYGLCSSFTVVEQYNEVARFLHMEDLVIPPNPFNADELESWMKIASKMLRQAESRLLEMENKVVASSSKKTNECIEMQQEHERCRKYVEELKEKLKSARNYSKFLETDLEAKYKSESDIVNTLKQTLALEKEQLQIDIQNHESFKKAQKDGLETLEGYRKEATKWTQIRDNLKDELAKEVSETQTFIKESTLRALERKRKFYLDNFGVDITKSTKDEKESGAISGKKESADKEEESKQ